MHKDQAIARYFSRAASAYDARAEVHRRIAAHLDGWLEGIAPGRILDAGCGTGLLTTRLASRFPQADIDALDVSGEMIFEARKSHPLLRRVAWQNLDIWNHSPTFSYDLITASSAFQWMQPLNHLFAHLRSMLSPRGLLAFSMLIDGTLEELRLARAAAAPEKILRGKLPTSAEVIKALQETGFQVKRQASESLIEEHASSRDLLQSIKSRGFTGGPLSAASAPLSRRELEKLCAIYEERFRSTAGTVPASYEAIYITAACHPPCSTIES